MTTRSSPTTCISEKMEKVALNNLQLDHLASMHPKLSRVFYGTVPCDRLPRTLLSRRRKNGLHCQYRSSRPTRQALDRPLDTRQRVRDYGQLRSVIKSVRNHLPSRRVVGSSFQVPDA